MRAFEEIESQGKAVEVTVNSKEENSEDIFLDFVQEFGLWLHFLKLELDLQILLGLLCTAVLIGGDPAPPPRIWAHLRGRYWSAKIDDISL